MTVLWGWGEEQVLRLPLVAQDDSFLGGKAGWFDAGCWVGVIGEGPGLKPVFWGVGTVA